MVEDRLMASWFSNALNWVSEQAQGVNSWLADQVGDVWDGVGSTFGFETTAQKRRRREAEELTNSWNAKRQEMADKWEQYKNEWTGTGGSQKAYNLAKSATGSIASAQTESAVKEAENAQRAVGVNKSQAAMNANNMAGSIYNDTYDVDTQAEKINEQIEKQNSQMEDLYNKELEQGTNQYNEALASVQAKKNSDLGLGAELTISDIFGIESQDPPIKSDENAKDGLMEVNADTCALFLLTILKDFEIHDESDIELLKYAGQFLDLYCQLRRKNNATK